MRVRHIDIEVVKDDITQISADALVNPAHPQLTMKEGLAAVFKQRGGEDLEREAVSKGPLKPGEAVLTGGGALGAPHVIHAVTVAEDGTTNDRIIREACAAVFQMVAEQEIKTIAMPALGCGKDGFPAVGSAKIMAQEILKFARNHPKSALQKITVCVFDEDLFAVFQRTVRGYLDHILDDLGGGPFVTVDAIIKTEGGIILIERSNPPYGWALPGGFVDYGESLEQAVRREAREETHLDLEDLRQTHTYSDPSRDSRFHTVTTVFVAKGKGTPQAGDDAKGLKVVPVEDLLQLEYAFDHRQVIQDYLEKKYLPEK